jgi:hypothetical protein
MSHTKGPWTLNPGQSTRVDLIDNSKGEAIGEIVWVDVRNPADAKLIKAAPDLLEALEGLLMYPLGTFQVAAAKAAIEAAKGQQT